MPKQWTHRQCFEKFGAVPRNPRWSWSGRSLDGRVVAVTLWQDRFEEKGRLYRSTTIPGEYDGGSSPGKRELIENLAWARDHCDGEVRIIIAKAKDIAASPRAIEECFPQENLRMKVIELDEAAQRFTLERMPK